MIHRKQALLKKAIDDTVREGTKIVFFSNITLKYTNTHRPSEPLTYQGYPLNDKLCIVNAVQCCLGMPENLVDANTNITYGKPYKLSSSGTISRWIKDGLGIAGINTNVYKRSCCWSASRSKAKNNGFSITDILKRGCWKSQNTFVKFDS